MPSQSLTLKNSRKLVPAEVHFAQNKPIYIPLFMADSTKKIQAVWELELENGERNSGVIKRNRIQFADLPVGKHLLTVIVGKPILGKGIDIYHTVVYIK